MNVNTVNFGDIIKEISHGLMAESYISDNEFTKPCEYLRLVDIDDGVIAANCIEIVYDSKRFEKYAIKDGDVILSTTDKNFKVVCAGDMGDRKLLVSPTLIRIGLDKEKADPYYIAAYLSSAEGKAMLDGCRSGKVVRILHTKGLKECEIPLPTMEEQREIGEKYRHRLHEIRRLKADIEGLYEDIEMMR